MDWKAKHDELVKRNLLYIEESKEIESSNIALKNELLIAEKRIEALQAQGCSIIDIAPASSKTLAVEKDLSIFERVLLFFSAR